MSAAPKCSTCIFMEVQGRAKMTANGFVEKGTRGDCVCSHPKALEAFRRVCPQSPRAPGFIGYTDPGGDVPRIKTSPRWCPLKAEADVQAALLGDHEAAKRPIILDLCGGSGSWSKPYKEAGYDVRLITLPDYDVLTYTPPENVYGVLAAPPCTEFSVLNCKAEPRHRKPQEGLKIVNACLRIIKQCNSIWWAMENPVGYLREYMGPSRMTFQPWEYGDPWTKRTDLWGTFTPPPKVYKHWEDVPNKLPLYTRPGRGKPNFAYLHKSAQKLIPQLAWAHPETDADFRAITPPGFVKAFFEANR